MREHAASLISGEADELSDADWYVVVSRDVEDPTYLDLSGLYSSHSEAAAQAMRGEESASDEPTVFLEVRPLFYDSAQYAAGSVPSVCGVHGSRGDRPHAPSRWTLFKLALSPRLRKDSF
jgi:hypothetical protein